MDETGQHDIRRKLGAAGYLGDAGGARGRVAGHTQEIRRGPA